MTPSIYRIPISELKNDYIPVTIRAAIRQWELKPYDVDKMQMMIAKLRESLERATKTEFIEIYKWYMKGGRDDKKGF